MPPSFSQHSPWPSWSSFYKYNLILFSVKMSSKVHAWSLHLKKKKSWWQCTLFNISVEEQRSCWGRVHQYTIHFPWQLIPVPVLCFHKSCRHAVKCFKQLNAYWPEKEMVCYVSVQMLMLTQNAESCKHKSLGNHQAGKEPTTGGALIGCKKTSNYVSWYCCLSD